MKKKRIPNPLCIIFLCIICNLTGCNNDIVSENEADKSSVSVKIEIGNAVWNCTQNINEENASVSKTIIPFSDGLLTGTLESSKDIKTRTSLDIGVRYRVIVYIEDNVSASGYVCHGDFTIGGINPVFQLYPGPTYTFICYSYNTTNALPDFNQSQTSIPVNSNVDFLYCKKNAVITSSGNNIPIELTHLNSQITVIAESTNEKAITACSGHFINNNSQQVSLTDGSTIIATSGFHTPIVWESLGTSTISSTPITVIPDAAQTTRTIRLNSITINGATYYMISFEFPNTIQAGYKYTIRLKLREKLPKPIPNAIDMNQQIYWAPGNLIGTPSADGTISYTFAPTQEYCSGRWDGGDYWKWCVLDPISNESYVGEYSTSLDPCQKVEPIGYWRMPTLQELNHYLHCFATKNGIYGTYVGTSEIPEPGSEDNYVFLPFAGSKNSTVLYDYQTKGAYWSSIKTPSVPKCAIIISITNSSFIASDEQIEVTGLPIRCVSDK